MEVYSTLRCYCVNGTRPYGSKPDGKAARTARRKSRVGAVLRADCEGFPRPEFEDLDVLSCVICDRDLERLACSVRRNVIEIEASGRDADAVGGTLGSTMNSDRNEELFLLCAQRVGSDNAGRAGADRGDGAVIGDESDRRVFGRKRQVGGFGDIEFMPIGEFSVDVDLLIICGFR